MVCHSCLLPAPVLLCRLLFRRYPRVPSDDVVYRAVISGLNRGSLYEAVGEATALPASIAPVSWHAGSLAG